MTLWVEAGWKWPTVKLRDQYVEFVRGMFPTITEEKTRRLNVPVWDEQIFNQMLAVEHRRAKRSRKSFVLMRVDVDQAADRAQTALFRAVPIVASSIRESDVVGWKRQGRTLGVIFTQAARNPSSLMLRALRTRMESVLPAKLGQEAAAKMAISMHVLPEDYHDLQSSPLHAMSAQTEGVDGVSPNRIKYL